jgi:hypothetical protein
LVKGAWRKFWIRSGWREARMNAFDREFWNGALKASIMIERDLKKLLREANPSEQEGIGVAIARVREIKEEIESLHSKAIFKALREIEVEED